MQHLVYLCKVFYVKKNVPSFLVNWTSSVVHCTAIDKTNRWSIVKINKQWKGEGFSSLKRHLWVSISGPYSDYLHPNLTSIFTWIKVGHSAPLTWMIWAWLSGHMCSSHLRDCSCVDVFHAHSLAVCKVAPDPAHPILKHLNFDLVLQHRILIWGHEIKTPTFQGTHVSGHTRFRTHTFHLLFWVKLMM